jgi:endonuclease/exonuclease/phosphatase (EEP) superfamily protein YafD
MTKKYLLLFLIYISNFSHALEESNMVGYRICEEEEIKETLSFGKAQASSLSEEFNITVWNIFKGIKRDQLKSVLPKIVDNSDISIFQEYEANDYLRPFFSSSQYFSIAGLTHQSEDDESTRAGVLTQSKVQPIADSCVALHSQNRELGLSPKATLACKFKLINEQELLVMNVHALNFQVFNIGFKGGFGFGQAYRNQIEQWAHLIQEHKGPVILAGDFNTWNPLGRRLKRLKKMLKKTQDGTPESEFKHIDQFFPDYRGRFLTLDHIFYRGLKIVGKPQTKKLNKASDHNPLFVRFRSL